MDKFEYLIIYVRSHNQKMVKNYKLGLHIIYLAKSHTNVLYHHQFFVKTLLRFILQVNQLFNLLFISFI